MNHMCLYISLTPKNLEWNACSQWYFCFQGNF